MVYGLNTAFGKHPFAQRLCEDRAVQDEIDRSYRASAYVQRLSETVILIFQENGYEKISFSFAGFAVLVRSDS